MRPDERPDAPARTAAPPGASYARLALSRSYAGNMRTRRGIVAAIAAAILASVPLTGCSSSDCAQVAMSVELNPGIIAPGGYSVVTVANAWSGCDLLGRAQARKVPVIIEVVEPKSLDVLATVTVSIERDGSGRGSLDLPSDIPEGTYLLEIDHGFDRNLWVTAHP